MPEAPYAHFHLDRTDVTSFETVWDDTSRARRRALLARVERAAEDSGVRPQLYGGTLLGYIRERKILEWDDDIDLALYEAGKIPSFNAALQAQGLRTFMHPAEGAGNIKIYDDSYDQIPGSEWGPYTWPFIDLFIFQQDKHLFVCKCTWNNVCIPRSRVLPGNCSSNFEGCRFWIPEDVLFMLDIFYPDWRHYEVTPSWNHRLEKPADKHRRRRIVTIRGRKLIHLKA